ALSALQILLKMTADSTKPLGLGSGYMSRGAKLMAKHFFAGKLVLCLLGVACVLGFVSQPLAAQGATAALTGTVADVSKAVIPNATVTLTSEQSGDTRRTLSNAEGYFTVSAIQ